MKAGRIHPPVAPVVVGAAAGATNAAGGTSPPPGHGLSGLAPAAASGGPLRRRVAMYAALLLLAWGVLLQAQGWQRLDRQRAADAQALAQAVRLAQLPLTIARAAANLLAATPAARPALVAALSAQLDEAAGVAGAAPATDDEADARHRALLAQLVQHGRAMLAAPADGDADAMRRHDAALQAQAEPAAAAVQAQADALAQRAERHAAATRLALQQGLAALLVWTLLTGLAIVEPVLRALRRRDRQLVDQGAELHQLALVAEHTAALVVVSDAEDHILWTNPAFIDATGWSAEQARGQCPDELMANGRADPAARATLRQAVARRERTRQECLYRRQDGVDLWLDVALGPLHDTHTGRLGFVRVCTDVTPRLQQQAKLQLLWAALPAGVVVQSTSGEIVDANPSAQQLLGQPLAQLQQRDAHDPRWQAVGEDGRPLAATQHPALRTLADGRALHNESLGIYTPEGELRWLLMNTEPQRDLHGRVCGVVSCFVDITERRRLLDRLRDSARTDPVTRLPNRTVVTERLQRALQHLARHPGYGFALLFMDLDHFKQVNDAFGHAAGDALLCQVAERLERLLRPGDAVARVLADADVAARLGGDEFVVVLDGVADPTALNAIADRVLAELAEPYLVEGKPMHIGASIGVVHCVDPATAATLGAADVLRNADIAMYEAKRDGRARWVLFDESMHQRAVRALALESDLRQALAEDELFVVYQPVLDLGTRALAGVEALVRWRHPTRGLVPPAEFIGAAEACGLIDAIGALVLRQGCAQFVRWADELGEAAPPALAVNLSRAQLERPALVDEVAAVLQATGMAPSRLQLEVTETLAAQDERVQSTLRALKAMGVRLALDDFGTGYSSLACLHQMPVDTVKIDRSFVRHAESVEYHRVLIEATIRVARTLGMRTVAEGIETEGEARLMQALGCDRGQGFLFARPLEAAALALWARRQPTQRRPVAVPRSDRPAAAAD